MQECIVNPDFKTQKIIVPQLTVTNWAGFTNQPTNDGVEILSNNTADLMYATIWGVDNNNILKSDTVKLQGTTVVSSSITNWKNIYGLYLGYADGHGKVNATGTITLRKASNDQTITTITGGNFHSGMIILDILGMNAEIAVFSGNLWYSGLKPVATATTGKKILFNTTTNETSREFIKIENSVLSLISDNTGASIQVVAFEN